MKFSIIIPVYNVEQYLQGCLDSVLQQSYTDYELICINDGSTDNSAAILEGYAKNYTNINVINQSNQGISATRNIGIKAASGDYLFFLDSDDWIEPDSLQILLQAISGEDMLCFNGRRYFEDGAKEVSDNGISEESLTGWEYYNKYALVPRHFHFVCVVLRLYRRAFLLEHNMFFEKGLYHEDNLFTPIACYYAKTVKVIPESLYIYRIRAGSITQLKTPQRIFDIVTVANKLAAFFIPLSGINKQVVYREIAGEYFKGFMPKDREIYGHNDKEMIKQIDWDSFKTVSKYPRHKRIFFLLKFHPVIFRLYIRIEQWLKAN